MKSKCEWVKGKFQGCEEMEELFTDGNFVWQTDNSSIRNYQLGVYYFCPFCGELLKKPVNIVPGVFGYFYTEDHFYFEWGYLSHIDSKGFYPCRNTSLPQGQRMSYPNFDPGLPGDVNPDGSPKEGEE